MNAVYGIDTVTLLAYFTDQLSSTANKIFASAEKNQVTFIIPSIVIGEMFYTIMKDKSIFGNKFPDEKPETILSTLYALPVFKIMDLDQSGWRFFLQSKIPELHDRMIVATCHQEQVTQLISTDKEIKEANEIKVIW